MCIEFDNVRVQRSCSLQYKTLLGERKQWIFLQLWKNFLQFLTTEEVIADLYGVVTGKALVHPYKHGDYTSTLIYRVLLFEGGAFFIHDVTVVSGPRTCI